jgi:hypothetical protein
MNKKAKKGIGLFGWLIIIYLGLGVYYHLTKNPNGSWINDLLTGGWNIISKHLMPNVVA